MAVSRASRTILLSSEQRGQGWYAEARDVPGTGSIAPTRHEAIAEVFRKLATAYRDTIVLEPFLHVVIAEPTPPGATTFSGADLRALLDRIPHPDDGWADDVEGAVDGQPSTSGESLWDS